MTQNSPSSFFICGASRERINSEVLRPLIPLIHSHPDGGLCAYCNVSGCSDVGHGFNCFNYVCTESACGSQLSRMWGECARAKQPAESPSACSRTLSMHIAESVVSVSQPCIICARSLACMLCTCTQKPHSSVCVSRVVRILSLLQIAV
jgi:hypothetical protein